MDYLSRELTVDLSNLRPCWQLWPHVICAFSDVSTPVDQKQIPPLSHTSGHRASFFSCGNPVKCWQPAALWFKSLPSPGLHLALGRWLKDIWESRSTQLNQFVCLLSESCVTPSCRAMAISKVVMVIEYEVRRLNPYFYIIYMRGIDLWHNITKSTAAWNSQWCSWSKMFKLKLVRLPDIIVLAKYPSSGRSC